MTSKKNNTLKMIISASMAALSIMSIGYTAFADEIRCDSNINCTSGISTNGVAPSGVSDSIHPVKPLEEQFVELLLNCDSSEQREVILKKAANMGITANDLKNVPISEKEVSILTNVALFNAQGATGSFTDRRTLTKDLGLRASTYSVVAGVDMPDYVLWPKIYCQETNVWCSAATIETVGKYIGANPPPQEEIMNKWEEWGYPYPTIEKVGKYLNEELPGKKSSYVPYVVKEYHNSQSTFNADLKNNVLNYQPMIIFMKDSTGANWPYWTNGHASIVNGLVTWEDNVYFIGDPFYFSKYVRSATANNGEHKRTWDELNAVIRNKYGAGYEKYLT